MTRKRRVLRILGRVFLAILITAVVVGAVSLQAFLDEKENPFLAAYRQMYERFDPPEPEPVYGFEKVAVPRVYLATEENYGKKLLKRWGYVPAHIKIVDADGTVLANDDGQLKIRGNSTSYGKKWPFNIKFSEKIDLFGMGKAKKYCLIANHFDKTLMRNYVALEFARMLDMPYTAEQRFVEVWYDGTFMGCYQLTEAVEQSKNRVAIDLDAGDFLIEYERLRREDDVTYIKTRSGLRFGFKEPEEPTVAEEASALNRLNGVVTALQSGDFSRVEQVLDVDSFVKYAVHAELIKPKDLNYSSVFFFWQEGMLHAGPAWDYDLSSGNSQHPLHRATEKLYADQYHLFKLLYAYPEFKRAVAERYLAEKETIEHLYRPGGFIDRIEHEYADAFERNYDEAGWLVYRITFALSRDPDATFEENVQQLQDWLQARDEWLTEYWTEYLKDS